MERWGSCRRRHLEQEQFLFFKKKRTNGNNSRVIAFVTANRSPKTLGKIDTIVKIQVISSLLAPLGKGKRVKQQSDNGG